MMIGKNNGGRIDRRCLISEKSAKALSEERWRSNHSTRTHPVRSGPVGGTSGTRMTSMWFHASDRSFRRISCRSGCHEFVFPGSLERAVSKIVLCFDGLACWWLLQDADSSQFESWGHKNGDVGTKIKNISKSKNQSTSIPFALRSCFAISISAINSLWACGTSLKVTTPQPSLKRR